MWESLSYQENDSSWVQITYKILVLMSLLVSPATEMLLEKWSTKSLAARFIRPDWQPLLDPEVNKLLQQLDPEVNNWLQLLQPEVNRLLKLQWEVSNNRSSHSKLEIRCLNTSSILIITKASTTTTGTIIPATSEKHQSIKKQNLQSSWIHS